MRNVVYLSGLTDAKLVKYFQHGNRTAFDVLVQRLEPKLKEYLHRLLRNKFNEEDVEEEESELEAEEPEEAPVPAAQREPRSSSAPKSKTPAKKQASVPNGKPARCPREHDITKL